MEFLNENFKTIDDLKRIDNIINGLNKEREDIENQILQKDNDGSNGDDLYEKIQLQAVEICQSLNSIVGDFLDKRVDLSGCQLEISKLVSKYGDLKLFEHIMKQVHEIDELRINQSIIEQYQVIFDEVGSLESIDNTVESDEILSRLQIANESIQNFDKQVVNCDLKEKIINTVNNKLSNIIVTQFKPVFMSSKAEYPTVADLKALLTLQSLDPLNVSVRPLWCLQLLIKQNFKLKFEYHYDSNVQTNALDKPEWFFLFTQKWISDNLDELNAKFSNIFQHTIYELESFKEQYVSAVADLLEYKIKKNLHIIMNLKDEAILSNLLMHLIGEILQNDDYYVKNFKISINLVDKLILSNEEYSHRWLEFEKHFNFEKYNKIISNDESFQIDFESVDKSITKPTNSSILVKNLLNNLTLKYKLIKNLNFKAKLLTNIQLRILESYYERLDEALDAFKSLFRKFKILSGKNEDEELITGVQGIDRLLRIYCSLEYLINSMEVWNEDLLFIQLSKLIKEETFFNTLINSYQHLAGKVIKTIDEFFNKEINTTLKPYFKISNWSRLPHFNQTITQELQNGLFQLSNLFNHLSRALSQIDLIPIIINFEERLIKFFNDNILNLNTFNKSGSLQIEYDFNQCFKILPLFTNMKSFLKFAEILRFLTLVNEDVVDDLSYSNYNNFYKFCDDNQLVILGKESQLALSIARRKVN